MKDRVELHLRSRPHQFHRSVGVVSIEHADTRCAPEEDIAFNDHGRRIKAHITCVQADSKHLPLIYADVIEDELEPA